MKPNVNTSPSQLIEHIDAIIKERLEKNAPTFFTISIEQFGKMTPVAIKQDSSQDFKKLMLKYTSNFELNAVQVDLYSGKSHNVKHPFQSYRIPLKTEDPKEIVLKGFEKDDLKVEQLESSIPVGRYFGEKLETQMQLFRQDIEKQTMMDKLNNLIEKYDEKLKAQEERHNEKVRELEEEIEELHEEIEEYQKEIYKYEKGKHDSLGNIAFATIGSKIAENFAKSEIGMGVLKGLLGKDGFATLQGHLKGIEEEQNQTKKETARVISKEEQSPRQIALNFIHKVGEALDDQHLRMLYDIAELTAKNIKDIEVLWNLAKEIEKQRNKPNTNNSATNSKKEDDEKETDDTKNE
jgi:hypothetical protein